jgi:thioredoxin 1
MSTVHALNDHSFEAEVIQSDIPVLVDFWATWCGPCKVLAPILEEIVSAYVDKVKFFKLDIDQNPITPSKFHIRSIPTLVLFKNGQAEATHVGMMGKKELMQFIDQHL